ncbi:class I SAM-dependent methyltransferase [Anditalea andensis]|uniref:Methylase n=1 Tax=Anditalea andensis TaxID=1048983 RepID=A0A074KSY8_9BACT|nr:class I SAM-dependent methyltransferase [Anditalea andensis]KEO72029.1 methylase [Anditalea andensis]
MSEKGNKYLHGYEEVEQERLMEQANVIESKIFDFIDYEDCQRLLEIGSGVGAQTEILLRRFPHLSITGIEYEQKQIDKAKKNLASKGCEMSRISFIQQDAKNLDLLKVFDAAFVCWVLEHVTEPIEILRSMKSALLPHAKVVITEVLNSTFYTYPVRKEITHYWEIYNDYQRSIGGDPEVGAKLGDMLEKCGYRDISLRSGGFHLDSREQEEKKKVFTYWKNLMSSGASAMIGEGVISEAEVDSMQQTMDELRDMPDSIFYYRFIQATAYNR